MKKRILMAIQICLIFVISACSNGSDQSQYTSGIITLPDYVSLDTSDQDMQIPFSIDGDPRSIEWTSSDEKIVVVDQEGVITIVKEGLVEITAKSGKNQDNLILQTTVDKYKGYTRINSKAEFLMTFSNPDNFNSPLKKYVLTEDIDFGGDNIEPIGGWDQSVDESSIDSSIQFRATLDGRGYALMNFTISDAYSTKVDGSYFGVSLIPFFYDGAVRNLNLINAHFSGDGFTGSIAGKILYGTIENCFVQGSVTATSRNLGIPAGGIAGIVGDQAVIRNVLIDVSVSGGYIYSGFNFAEVGYSNAISETLGDQGRRGPMLPTAETTMKEDEEEDAALKEWINSPRIEANQVSDFDSYTFTADVKGSVWTISQGTMPYLLRQDGTIPNWAKIE